MRTIAVSLISYLLLMYALMACRSSEGCKAFLWFSKKTNKRLFQRRRFTSTLKQQLLEILEVRLGETKWKKMAGSTLNFKLVENSHHTAQKKLLPTFLARKQFGVKKKTSCWETQVKKMLLRCIRGEMPKSLFASKKDLPVVSFEIFNV